MSRVMGMIAKMLGLNKSDTALVIGGDCVSLAVGPDGVPWKMPAYVAIHAASKRVLAVGEEAKKMYGREPVNIKVLRFTSHGGFGLTQDLGEAALRYVLRSRVRAKIAPRIVVAVPEQGKISAKEACTRAGCREVVTIRPAMAAALGCGLAVDAPEIRAVFVLERDWCAFALISLSGFVAEFELPLGIDSLLEDVALHAMATRNVALDLESLHETFLSSGLSGGEMLGWETWLDELETGRVTSASYSEKDMMRGALPWLYRMRWQYRTALQAVDKAKTRDGSVAPLHFCSPYAKLPGMTQLVAKIFSREVIVPEAGELAMVRGVQVFLKHLDELYRVAADF